MAMDKDDSSAPRLFILYHSRSAVSRRASIVSPSCGKAATPMLAESGGRSLSVASRLRMRDATNPAALASVSGSPPANQSPPDRAAAAIPRQNKRSTSPPPHDAQQRL